MMVTPISYNVQPKPATDPPAAVSPTPGLLAQPAPKIPAKKN